MTIKLLYHRAEIALFSLLVLGVFLGACTTLKQSSESEETAEHEVDVSHGREMMLEYFAEEVDALEGRWLEDSKENWEAQRSGFRQQYAEMLGLRPMPERTDLKPVVTDTIIRDGVEVRKLHFQSMPGLYVTANLYLPVEREGELPGVLYLPGHTIVEEDGISYGPKAADHYQTHPIWYAQNGIASLIIDTLHGGEIQGIHHGTRRYGRWWWFNRGYTPAGIQTWNAIRGLDYLEGLDEVDASRLAVTGLSGGGADSWSVNALDDRPVTVVPAAGMSDLRGYLVDQKIANHCDCMFPVNRYRWDLPKIAALGAPRPVVLSNNTDDDIFPLDGAHRIDRQVAEIYDLYDRADNWDILVREGGHGDRPQRPEMHRIIHERLTGETLPEEAYEPADPLFSPEELLVFGGDLPEEERNTSIDEELIEPASIPAPPGSRDAWERMREEWQEQLDEMVFTGWPAKGSDLDMDLAAEEELDGLRLRAWDFTSQGPIRLRLWLLDGGTGSQPEEISLKVLNDSDWEGWLSQLVGAAGRGEAAGIIGPGAEATAWPEGDADVFDDLASELASGETAIALVAPRGVGPTNWQEPDAEQNPIRRSFMVLGQTRDGMQVWDVRRSIAAISQIGGLEQAPVSIEASNAMAGVALYASLYEDVSGLHLTRLPDSHREGPIFLNIDKVFDLPQALALAAERAPVLLQETPRSAYDWADRTLSNLEMDARLSAE